MRTVLALLILFAMPAIYASQNKNANIFIFISFSMPKESIKGWMKEAAIIHAPVVIRGLVNNSFKATIQKMADLAKDNQGGMQVDPNLFRRYNIKNVPAVVVTNQANCLPTQSCREDYDVIYGNVHLGYALEKIMYRDDAVSAFAQEALITLREGAHG